MREHEQARTTYLTTLYSGRAWLLLRYALGYGMEETEQEIRI